MGEGKSVRVQSKKENPILIGVKIRQFGVKEGKFDIWLASLKNEEISLA